MGIFSSWKKEELVAVFDIGSASVSGALVLVARGKKNDKGKKPSIVFTTTVDIEIEQDLNFDRFEAAMESAVSQAARNLKAAKRGAPKKAFCFMASPWYASQVRTVRLSRGAPTVFTEKLLLELVNKEIALFESTDLARFGDPENLKLLEAKNIEVKLNGYVIPEPFGKRARDIELSVFFSVSPKSVLRAIEDAIEKSFTLSRVNFFSFLFSSFIITRNLFAHDPHFLLIDVGGEVTDVSLVKRSNLSQSSSFPLGRNFIFRRLSSGLGKTIAEVKSLLALYFSGGMDENTKSVLAPILDQAKKDWLSAFQKTLFLVTDELSVPEKVLLSIDDDVAPWFVGVIEKEEFSQYVLSEKKFNVIIVGASAMHDFCDCQGDVARNPFLMLEAIFVDLGINQK